MNESVPANGDINWDGVIAEVARAQTQWSALNPYLHDPNTTLHRAEFASHVVPEQLFSAHDAQLHNTFGQFGNGQGSEVFWPVTYPLLEALLNRECPRVAWAAVGVRLNPPASAGTKRRVTLRFHYRGSIRSIAAGNGNWNALQLVSALANLGQQSPYQILTTTDLCLNVLHNNAPFTVLGGGQDSPRSSASWVLDCSKLVAKLRAELSWRNLLDAATSEIRPANAPTSRFRDLMGQLNSWISRHWDGWHPCKPELVPKEGENDDRAAAVKAAVFDADSGAPLGLCKYLMVMTAVTPNWSRMTMVPTPSPVSTFAQPGGLIICEECGEDDRVLTTRELGSVAVAMGVAMAPLHSIRAREEAQAVGRHFAKDVLLHLLRHNYNNTASVAQNLVESLRGEVLQPESVASINGRLALHSIALDQLVALYQDPGTDGEGRGHWQDATRVLAELRAQLDKIVGVKLVVKGEKSLRRRMWRPEVSLILFELFLNASKHALRAGNKPIRLKWQFTCESGVAVLASSNRASRIEVDKLRQQIECWSKRKERLDLRTQKRLNGLDLCRWLLTDQDDGSDFRILVNNGADVTIEARFAVIQDPD